MLTPEESPQPLFTDQVRELVAIAAAIAANCEPCFKFHYDKARKLGVSDDDMRKAVETAVMVKVASAKNVLDLANKYLRHADAAATSVEKPIPCCS